MAPIIDFHAHVLPAPPVGPLENYVSLDKIKQARKLARGLLRPLAGQLHQAQTVLRYLPEVALKGADQLSALLPLPSLLVESTAADLAEAMAEAKVDYTVIIAHPPLTSNELILRCVEENPRLIAAVNIPNKVQNPGEKLKEYVDRGAQVLKIHPAADGLDADAPKYAELLKAADELELPVILHTGCIHSKLLYRKPELGHVEHFASWFESHSKIKFVLAHMNFHRPQVALDLAEQYPNVWVDTSWQPAEMIGEAARRIGSERVLFGTDWPLVGHNIDIGINRIYEAADIGLLKPDDVDRILGGNAAKLLELPPID